MNSFLLLQHQVLNKAQQLQLPFLVVTSTETMATITVVVAATTITTATTKDMALPEELGLERAAMKQTTATATQEQQEPGRKDHVRLREVTWQVNRTKPVFTPATQVRIMRKAVVPIHRALRTRDRKLARIAQKLLKMAPLLMTLPLTPTLAIQHVITQVTIHQVLPGPRSKLEERPTETGATLVTTGTQQQMMSYRLAKRR